MSEQRSIWCIREKVTKLWVTSARFGHLGTFEEASIFHQEKNASKAIRDLNSRNLELQPGQVPTYFTSSAAHPHVVFLLPEDPRTPTVQREHFHIIESDGPQFEMVECTLST